MKVKNLGNKVSVIVTNKEWADTIADFGTEKADGATVSEGSGHYKSLSAKTIQENIWEVTIFTKNVLQFQIDVLELLQEYLQDTKEESVLVHTGGQAKLYYL
jgi:hypothetical protein